MMNIKSVSMYNTTDDDPYQPGWFPMFELRFTRATDLLFCALVLALGLFVLLCMIYGGKILINGISSQLKSMLLVSMQYVYTLTEETTLSAFHTVQKIPIVWYPVTALTILPMTVDIQRPVCVLYLLAYCVANILVLFYGVQNKEETIDPKKTTPDPKHTTPAATRSLNSQLFTGMRITIQ